MDEQAEPEAPGTAGLRFVLTILLSALYALIAVAKVRSMVKVLGAENVVGDDRARHWFTALDQASGALFFGALAVVMLVRRAPIRRERRAIGWILPICVMVMFSLLGIPEPTSGSLGLVITATVVTVGGTVITMYSLAHLGRNFGVVADVRGFVAAGPYRVVRHPLYAGELLTTLGLMLLIATPVTIAMYALGTALQIWRATVEEHSLVAAVPEYVEYAARTPMLLPRLGRDHHA